MSTQDFAESQTAQLHVAGATTGAERPATHVLVLALPPYAHSHRAGKIARSYARRCSTAFLSLQAAGRSTPREAAGHWVVDGLDVTQVHARPPDDAHGPLTPAVNLLLTYLPAFLRLARATWRTPAAVVHVNGTYLLPLGALHRVRHRSVLVLEVDERPGSAQHQRSVGLVFRPFESLVLRALAPRVDLVVTVAPSHRRILESRYRFARHVVARNAPEQAVRGEFIPPRSVQDDEAVVFATASSIFEGRCFELLVEACALLKAAGSHVSVRVAGYGRPAYVESLRALARAREVESIIEFSGLVPLDQVPAVYAAAHVGLSLYEPEFAHNDSLPNKVLESVSFGRPVLATGQPDVDAFITATSTGWLSTSAPARLAASMREIEQGLRSGLIDLPALSARCRALGDTELSWEHEFAPVLDAVGVGIRDTSAPAR